jgi:hypothetical protein
MAAGRKKGGKRAKNREIRAPAGCFYAKKPLSEPKLLEVIDALLTTTGCGQTLRRPQPMGIRFFAVNRFVHVAVLFLRYFLLATG